MSIEDDAEPEREKVGYKRPPTMHRFKKNTSGNPRGRPRRKTNFDLGGKMDTEIAKLVLSEAGRKISVRENGRHEEISIKAAVLRMLIQAALNGDLRSQTEILKLILAAERKRDEQEKAWTCQTCTALAAKTDEELIQEIMEMQATGKFKPPGGVILDAGDDDDDDDPWGVG